MPNAVHRTVFAVVVTLILGALTAYYVHVQQNRFTLVSVAPNRAVEIDRRTGQTWLIQDRQKEPHSSTERPTYPIPSADLRKLTGTAEVSLGSFSGKLYNGTEWVVKDVLFEVSANPGEPDELAKFIFEPSQKVAVGENTVPSEWTRKLKASFHLEPYTTEEFSRKVPEQEARVNWSIVEAHGYRP